MTDQPQRGAVSADPSTAELEMRGRLRAERNAARARVEQLEAETTDLRAAVAAVVERPMPDGNASSATEIERIKLALRDALDAR